MLRHDPQLQPKELEKNMDELDEQVIKSLNVHSHRSMAESIVETGRGSNAPTSYKFRVLSLLSCRRLVVCLSRLSPRLELGAIDSSR